MKGKEPLFVTDWDCEGLRKSNSKYFCVWNEAEYKQRCDAVRGIESWAFVTTDGVRKLFRDFTSSQLGSFRLKNFVMCLGNVCGCAFAPSLYSKPVGCKTASVWNLDRYIAVVVSLCLAFCRTEYSGAEASCLRPAVLGTSWCARPADGVTQAAGLEVRRVGLAAGSWETLFGEGLRENSCVGWEEKNILVSNRGF